jgi:peptidoglycan/LPS O-acetylase OafA/YrhL
MREVELVQPVSGSISASKAQRTWVKPLVRAILFGALSLSAYLLVFLNEETITKYFSRGGIYCIVVVVTAIAFSLIHGTFANYVLELVGIRAKDSH